MKSLLLLKTIEIVLICAIIVAIFFAIALFLIKRDNPKSKNEKANDKFEMTRLQLNEKYMFRKEMKFYALLNIVLPKTYIAFPKVGVDNLVLPFGSKVDYQNIISKYVDFVVFEVATMRPLLIIDIYDNTFGDESLNEQEPQVTKALKTVGLPMISIQIMSQYNENEIKDKLLAILNPKKDEDNKEKA